MPGFRLIGPEGQVYLIEGETTFGRDPSCNYPLDNSQISRRHATFYEDGDTFMLRDAGSANGTFLNGRRLSTPAALSPGDEIRLGGTVLTVPGGTAPGSSTPLAVAASAPHATPQTERRSRLPLIIGGCAVIALCLVAGIAALVFLPRTGLLSNLPKLGGSGSGGQYSLDQALNDKAIDDRPQVLAILGWPDAFTISQIVVDGVPVRVETCSITGTDSGLGVLKRDGISTQDSIQ